MQHKRVLLLGPTGVNKSVAAKKVVESARRELGSTIKYIDFEKDFLQRSQYCSSWQGFLFGNVPLQMAAWRDGWGMFAEDLRGVGEADVVILGLHASYVRSDEGVRSIIDLQSICSDFKPTLIVTLIDDVFNMWWRTEHRSADEYYKGRPSLEQLLEARRAEATIGVLLGCQKALSHAAKHVLLSVHHPVDVLRDLILFGSDIVYLSFPISAPRDLLRENKDGSFISLVNDYHRLTCSKYVPKLRPKKVYVSPLSIDELPLVEVAMEQPKESKDFEFDPDKHRWPVRDLWGDAELLTDSPPVRSRIPLKQAQDVAGLIGTDVGWRDFKLVRQSRSLGVLCPKPPNRKRLSRGVEAEMRAAIEGADTNIYVWQKRDWDPEKVLASVIGTPGSMGTDPLQQRTKIVDTMEELVDRMLSA